jgi:hypothetical protein
MDATKIASICKPLQIENIKVIEKLADEIAKYKEGPCFKEFEKYVISLYPLYISSVQSDKDVTLTEEQQKDMNMLSELTDIFEFNLGKIVNVLRQHPRLKNGMIPHPYFKTLESEEIENVRNKINTKLKNLDKMKHTFFKAKQILAYFQEGRNIAYMPEPMVPVKKNFTDLIKSVGRQTGRGQHKRKTLKFRIKKVGSTIKTNRRYKKKNTRGRKK